MRAEQIFFENDSNFVCVLRGLFSPETLAACRADFLARHAVAAGESLNPRADIQGVAPDALRLDRRWYEPWLKAELKAFFTLCRGFDQLCFPPQLRHIRQAGHFVPWHQDIAYQLSMGARGHKEVATCFVPIDDEPTGRTTVEFALAPGEAPRPHFDAGIFHNALKDVTFEKTVSFDLELGDGIFFGALVPHRTYQKPGHSMDRSSLEFRLARPGGVIAGKDYLDLKTKTFYIAQEKTNGQA